MMQKQNNLIYLASPFSHVDKKVEDERYVKTLNVTAHLLSQPNTFVFSPIVYGYRFYKDLGFKGDAKFWSSFNYCFFSKCDRLLVLKLPGWKESKGIKEELAWSEEFSIVPEYIEEYVPK